MNKHEFADFVYKSRSDCDMTLKEFAEELDIDWVTVWRWENKRNMPKPDAINHWIEEIIGICDAD